MRKINWKKILDKILNVCKFTLFTIVMLCGFWAIYIFMWYELGFPTTTPAMWLLFGQAVISELLFFKWFK